jgi:hypothetical protein
MVRQVSAQAEGGKEKVTEAAVQEKDPAFVEVKQNDAREAALSISITGGGVSLQNWAQSVDYAKYMAKSQQAVSKHLRDNIGMCIAVLDLATRWGFSPFMLAQRCHVINDALCFESQVIHAVIEKFAPLKYRLRPTYAGEIEDGTRTCKIAGHFKGEMDPLEYETPLLGKISPKNSPLWKTDPDQQLFYMGTTRWGRRYCPDILFGVKTREEMEDSHVGFEHAKDVTPKLAERLRALGGDGAIASAGFATDETLANIDEALSSARGETST